MAKLENMNFKISIGSPMEQALSYIEQVVRSREEWPIDRVMAIKKIMVELDKVMIEITNTSVNPATAGLSDKKEEE